MSKNLEPRIRELIHKEETSTLENIGNKVSNFVSNKKKSRLNDLTKAGLYTVAGVSTLPLLSYIHHNCHQTLVEKSIENKGNLDNYQAITHQNQTLYVPKHTYDTVGDSFSSGVIVLGLLALYCTGKTISRLSDAVFGR